MNQVDILELENKKKDLKYALMSCLQSEMTADEIADVIMESSMNFKEFKNVFNWQEYNINICKRVVNNLTKRRRK